MFRKGILGKSGGSVDQRTYRADLSVQVELAGTEDSALDLDHVLVAVDDAVDGNSVAVVDLEGVHLELINIMYGIALARLPDQSDRLLVGVAGEASGILEQGAHTLVLAPLVGSYLDDILVLQADVARQTSVEDVLVDIDDRHEPSLTEHLDVTQRTQPADASCRVEGMEGSGKG